MEQALTVLVVDDSEAMRMILAAILKSRGHDVVLADGVDRALDLLEVQRPDIILTDYNMPDQKGSDLVRRVRGRRAFDDTPVFVVSSEEAPEIRSQMAAAGANGWIAKPVCASLLLSVIDAAETGLADHVGVQASTPSLARAR